MSVNIKNFKNVLKKSTLNFSLDTVQINLYKDRIVSKMTTNTSDAIVMLNVDNNVISGINENHEIQLNFVEPNNTLVPYINLLNDEDEVDISFHKEKITIKSQSFKSDVFFCDPSIVSVFNRPENREHKPIFVIDIDDDFIEKFEMIKKIGARFGKIYFTVKDNILKMETTDKTILYSNNLSFDLGEFKHKDFSFCFDYRNVVNTMSSIGSEYGDFKMGIIKAPDSDETGMLTFINKDKSEKYYLLSKLDI
jgi:hypothetical protein